MEAGPAFSRNLDNSSTQQRHLPAVVKKRMRLTSACLQAGNDMVDSVLYRAGPKSAGGAQVQLDVVSTTRGVGASGHGLSLAHVRGPEASLWRIFHDPVPCVRVTLTFGFSAEAVAGVVGVAESATLDRISQRATKAPNRRRVQRVYKYVTQPSRKVETGRWLWRMVLRSNPWCLLRS